MEQIDNAVAFYAFFVASKTGKTGLTVTVDVWRITETGTATEVVTAGSATEIGDGLYRYNLASGSVTSAGEYLAVFKTADSSVDQQHIPALWIVGRGGVENLDAAISSRNATTPPTAEAVADAVRTELSTELARVDAAISSRNATTPPTAAANASAVRTELATELALVDVAISSRNATTPPTAEAVADAVWDEAAAGHVAAGSTGALLAASGGASDPLLNLVPGSYGSGTAGAALGRIGNAQITVVAPVSEDGAAISLVYGDDYYAADGRALTWQSEDWPVLTGATVALRVQSAAGVVSVTGAVLAADQVRVELSATNVASIGVGTWRYDLQATLVTSTHVVTLVTGYITIDADVR